MIVDRHRRPELYHLVHNANLLRQYDLLATKVTIALETGFRINFPTVADLNAVAVMNLHGEAGLYRFSTNTDVSIDGSRHEPPKAPEVMRHMRGFERHVGENWDHLTLLGLPAFAAWHLTWIHPFADGNGRTAQAVCYYLLCLKAGKLLGGREILPKLIRQNRREWCDLLAAADESFRDHGAADLEPMERFLGRLLEIQLSS